MHPSAYRVIAWDPSIISETMPYSDLHALSFFKQKNTIIINNNKKFKSRPTLMDFCVFLVPGGSEPT